MCIYLYIVTSFLHDQNAEDLKTYVAYFVHDQDLMERILKAISQSCDHVKNYIIDGQSDLLSDIVNKVLAKPPSKKRGRPPKSTTASTESTSSSVMHPIAGEEPIKKKRGRQEKHQIL